MLPFLATAVRDKRFFLVLKTDAESKIGKDNKTTELSEK